MRNYGVVAVLLLLTAVLAAPLPTGAAGPRPQPARDARGRTIPNVFTLTLQVGESSTFTLGPNLSNVVAGPADVNPAPTPTNPLPCTSSRVSGGGGDRDVSDTITITSVRPGLSIVLMAVEEWRLNFINTPGQRKPGNVGHWVQGLVAIYVTCVDRPNVPTGDPRQPQPGNPGNPGHRGHPQGIDADTGHDLFDARSNQPLSIAMLTADDDTGTPVGLSPDQALCGYPDAAAFLVYERPLVELARRLFGDVRGLNPVLVDAAGPGGARIRLCDLSGGGQAATVLVDHDGDGSWDVGTSDDDGDGVIDSVWIDRNGDGLAGWEEVGPPPSR